MLTSAQWDSHDQMSPFWANICKPADQRTPAEVSLHARECREILEAAQRQEYRNVATGEMEGPIPLPLGVRRPDSFVGSSSRAPAIPPGLGPPQSGPSDNHSATADASRVATDDILSQNTTAKPSPFARALKAAIERHPNRLQKPVNLKDANDVPSVGGSSSSDQPIVPTLQMAHTSVVDCLARSSMYQVPNVDRFISKSSRLYQYGGFAKRVASRMGPVYDVMICSYDVCLFCQNWLAIRWMQYSDAQTLAELAENDAAIVPRSSPFKGLPHVHQRGDCEQRQALTDDTELSEPGWNFKPSQWSTGPSPSGFYHAADVWFDDSKNGARGDIGCWGKRQASMCDESTCEICSVLPKPDNAAVSTSAQAKPPPSWPLRER